MSEKNSGDKPDLDEELDRLQARLPHKVSRFMKKVRSPEVAPYRIPAGIALTAGGLVGFLPIVGILDGAARARRAGAGRAGDAPAAGAAVAEVNGKRKSQS